MQIIHKGNSGIMTKSNAKRLKGIIESIGKEPLYFSSLTMVIVNTTCFIIRNKEEHNLLPPMLSIHPKNGIRIHDTYVYWVGISKGDKKLYGDSFKRALSEILITAAPKRKEELKFILNNHPGFSRDCEPRDTNLFKIKH